jgi:flagellar biosynthesis GTPase FlhF
MIVGELPPHSVDRLDRDDLIPPIEKGVKISDSLNNAILKALSVRIGDRFQTVDEFENALLNKKNIIIPKSIPKKSNKHLLAAVGGIFFAIAIAVGIISNQKTPPIEETNNQTDQARRQAELEKKLAAAEQQARKETEIKAKIVQAEQARGQSEQDIRRVEEQAHHEREAEKARLLARKTRWQAEQYVSSKREVKPAQFIRDYYAGISNQQYNKTWSMLSHHFKKRFHGCYDDGSCNLYDYLKWWKTISRVKVLKVNVLEQYQNTAKLKVKLRYFKHNGSIIDNNHRFKLVKDITNNWLIN